MDILTKKDNNTVTIVPTPVQLEAFDKTLSELEADLEQAIASREYVISRHIEELIPIDNTIAIFQKRVDDATALGITTLAQVKEVL